MRRHHQHGAAGLLQGVFQLMHPITGVDVHQDRPDLAGGELGDRPLGPVGRPDADAFAFLQPKRHQSTGAAVDLHLKLAIGITQLLVADNQRLLIGVLGDDLIEHLTNGAP